MSIATVNGVECTIYDYGVNPEGHKVAQVKYPTIPTKLWVPMSMIEVQTK